MQQSKTTGLDNVLRLALAGKTSAAARNGLPDAEERLGATTFDLLHDAVEAVRRNEQYYEDLTKRAEQQLMAAIDRIEFLEGRVRYFEERALQAEAWLARIREEVEQKLVGQHTKPERDTLAA